MPETVHQLRPGDIDVIGAMGDSLSAGLGIFATNIFQVVIENRGVTATIGGQSNWREFLTLPNIIKVLEIFTFYFRILPFFWKCSFFFFL